ncbi:MAG: hypothetical protein LBG73_08655 [Spirochaetaceae bacterium]|jgi:hypothetical protein|nr:hypothetical protein [Spirochaetaceae bacterium]
MRKLLALSVILSVLGLPALFAEVTVSGQFDAALIPLQVLIQDGDVAKRKGEEEIAIGAGLGRNGSNNNAPRARVGIVAQDPDGKVGLNFKLQFNANSSFRVAFDDFAEVWWKPIDWLKFDVGRFNIDTLRGKIGDDGWQHYTVRMKSPDEIFTRFQGQSNARDNAGGGFAISLTPLEGLFVGVGVPGLISIAESNESHTDWVKEKALYAYQYVQAAVGYEIGGIGLARVQYVGAKPAVDKLFIKDPVTDLWIYNTSFDPYYPTITAPKIEVAFAFTGMEGLVIDLGAKIPFGFKEPTGNVDIWKEEPDSYTVMGFSGDKVTWQAPFQVSLGAGFTTGPINILARIDTKFAGSVKIDTSGDPAIKLPFVLNAHLWPSYDLGFATVGIDFGLEFKGKTTDQDDKVIGEGTSAERNGGVRVGFGAWIKKSIGPCSIRGGLAYRLGTEVDSTKEIAALTVPILFDYSF